MDSSDFWRDFKIFTAFVIVSISSMFPNNAFMNAHEYFYYKLRNVTAEHDDGNLTSFLSTNDGWQEFKRQVREDAPTEMQADFEAYLTVYGGIACVLGSIINVFATKSLSNSCRVIWGHILVILVFIPTIALTFIDFDSAQDLFFNISMGLISIACFASLGMIAGGVLGLSAIFPAKYTQAVMIGQSAAGVLAALASILCQASTSNVILNGQMYFVFSLLMAILSIVVYFWLNNIEIPQNNSGDEENQRLLEAEAEAIIENQAGNFPAISEDEEDDSGDFRSQFEQCCGIVRKSFIDLLTISIVLLVTLAAYPGLTSLVRSTSRNHTWNSYFSAVASFLLYNIGDFIGRSCANSVRLNRFWLLTIASLRVLLIPLLVMCNVMPRVHTHSILPYDGVFILIVILLAVSHGFCITNATIGATLEIDKNSRELAGSIVSLIGVTAAMLGGVMGVLVIKLV
ncbi:unnamed protein product [Caenorhabditis angaria]|uniref:Uncharacterized protein n=1 Tax=Caenorhabditis angaria TaxID=860376 RepID=A0A9P1MXB2_9PELO|nr:unnamed protein product [Caenorhabditis angaria]